MPLCIPNVVNITHTQKKGIRKSSLCTETYVQLIIATLVTWTMRCWMNTHAYPYKTHISFSTISKINKFWPQQSSSSHTVTFVTSTDWLHKVRPAKKAKIQKCIASLLNRWLAWPCNYVIRLYVKLRGHGTTTLKSPGGKHVSCEQSSTVFTNGTTSLQQDRVHVQSRQTWSFKQWTAV